MTRREPDQNFFHLRRIIGAAATVLMLLLSVGFALTGDLDRAMWTATLMTALSILTL